MGSVLVSEVLIDLLVGLVGIGGVIVRIVLLFVIIVSIV